MVEDDHRVRECAGEIGEFVDLGMKEPGVEREAEARKDRKPLSEAHVSQQPARRAVGRIAHGGVSIPGGDTADAAQAVAAGTDVRL